MAGLSVSPQRFHGLYRSVSRAGVSSLPVGVHHRACGCGAYRTADGRAETLKALNNLAQFTLVPEAGAVSPELLAEWVGGAGPATACYEQAARPQLALVNLCSSLTHSEEAVQRAEQFLARHGA